MATKLGEYFKQGLYSGRPICPVCQHQSMVQSEPFYKRNEYRAIWTCEKCLEAAGERAKVIYYTLPQSHFVCCGTLTCPDCQGRGWFRR